MRQILRKAASLMALLLLCGMLSSCSRLVDEDAQEQSMTLYATFYPLYALTQPLLENVPGVSLNCLVQPQDGCLRDYQLSDWDSLLLARSADAIIAGGRGLESFETALYSFGSDGPAVAEVLYNMELYQNGQEAAQEDESESHWQDENPHIYMKLDGALGIAESIAAHLATLDPKYESLYLHNLEGLENRLKSLQEELHTGGAALSGTKVIVLNEALVYVAEEYGMEMESFYDRDSGEAFYDTELESFLDKLRKSESRIVLIEQQAPEMFVRAIEEAGFSVAKLDILSTKRAQAGFDGYCEAMRENLQALLAACGNENQ